MRISATVEVSNRSVPSLNMSKRRPEKSYLTIGFVSNRKDKIFILHQTLSNSVGVKYKVSENVYSILDRFSNDGKFTIRFTEPTVDLIVKGEPHSVKKFLNILKCSLNLNVTKVPNLSNLMAAPTRVISEPTTKLIIKKKTQLPSDFPRSLRHLEITDCTLTKFPFGVLRLQYMKVLILKNNDIEEIPNQIELLPSLEELILENNKLGASSKFSWLKCNSLRERLTVLDLRKNEIKFFPKELLLLKSINALFLDHNKLKVLPSSLWKLRSSLRTLTVSHNEIKILPGGMLQLRLQYLDVSENPFSPESQQSMSVGELKKREYEKVPSLLAIAGTTVLQKRVKFDEEMLPRTLIDYLDNADYCICGTPTFGGFTINQPLPRDLIHHVCREYNVSMSSPQPAISIAYCHPEGCKKYLPVFRMSHFNHRMEDNEY